MSKSNPIHILAVVLALAAPMLGAQDVPPIYLNFALPGYLSLYPEPTTTTPPSSCSSIARYC